MKKQVIHSVATRAGTLAILDHVIAMKEAGADRKDLQVYLAAAVGARQERKCAFDEAKLQLSREELQLERDKFTHAKDQANKPKAKGRSKAKRGPR